VLVVAGAVLLALAALGIQASRIDERKVSNAERARDVLVARTVKNAIMGALIDHKQREFQNVIRSLPEGEILSVALYGRKGDLRFYGLQPGAPAIPRTLEAVEADLGSPYVRAGGSVLAVRLPIQNDASCRNCHGRAADVLAFVELYFSRTSSLDAVGWGRQREFISISITLAVLVLALVVATELFVIRPLRLLTSSTKNISNNAEVSLRAESDDELGTFVKQLNEMLSEMRAKISALESYHFETMRQAQKMSTIGELASALAHEIKNPMAGISGALQVFVEDCAQDDVRREVVKEVQLEIERLDRAFKDLLSFARSHERHPVKTTLNDVLAPAVRLIGNQAKKQKVHVNIEQPGVPADLYVDPEEMQQVFLNIMVNTLQDMPEGGNLDIRVIYNTSKRELVASFIGDGESILQADIDAAFDPVISSGRSSRGLGLGISRRLAEHNGGRITMVNRASGGATYTVVLPMTRDHV
jgi:signal transduction histidine kinase